MAIAKTLDRFLKAQGVAHDSLQHRYTEGSYATAQSAHIPAHQLLKGVVLRDEDFVYTMAVVPSDHRVLRQTLNDILGRHLQLADEDELEALLPDCSPGAIPALGQAWGLKVIWDYRLAQLPDVWIEGGDHCHLIHLQQADFRRLMSPHPCDTISRDRQRFGFSLLPRTVPETDPAEPTPPAHSTGSLSVRPGN